MIASTGFSYKNFPETPEKDKSGKEAFFYSATIHSSNSESKWRSKGYPFNLTRPRILEPHYVLVTRIGPGQSLNKTYDARLTYKGIYSTLSKGNLKVIFPGEHPHLEQDKIGNLVVQRLQKELPKKVPTSGKMKSKAAILIQTAPKTISIIKGIQISLYKDSEKMVEKDDREYSSDEENTDIILQVEVSDIVSIPLQFENPKEEI